MHVGESRSTIRRSGAKAGTLRLDCHGPSVHYAAVGREAAETTVESTLVIRIRAKASRD